MLRHRIKKDILNGNIFEQMMLLFFPVFLGYLLQHVYGFVDAIVLGKFVGKQALASVGGSATAIINLILNIIAGINAAITVMVAQNHGRGDSEKVNSVIRTGYFIAIVFGGFISVLMLIISPTLLNIMKEPVESMSGSLIYLRLYSISFVPYFIYQTGICILRALGDNKRPNYFILITAVTKIVFDLLLAGIFKLGVLGTSIATLLSYLICAAVTLLVFGLTPDIYRYTLKDFGFNLEELKTIFKMGTPFAIQNAAYSIPNMMLQSRINEFGTDAIAAYSAYLNVDNVFWCYANSVSTITLTMAGQNFGNKNIARVRKIALAAVVIEEIGALLLGLSFTVFDSQLLSLFLTDPEVIEIGITMLAVTSLKYFLHMFVGTLSAVFKSCGLVRFPATATIFTILVSRVVFLLFYPHSTPADPVYCFPISWTLTSIVYLTYFLTNKKLKVSN